MIDFKAVKRHVHTVGMLRKHIENNRLAHAYLLTGESDADKEMAALAFASALNCEKGVLFESCECVSCRKVLGFQHPDVHWLGRDLSVRSIKIAEVRDVVQESALKPYEGRWKVFVFIAADRLTLDAQNALLKTLEEPPGRSVFILFTEAKEQLLDTIQSRAFELKVLPQKYAESETQSQWLPSVADWEDYLEPLHSKTREEIMAEIDRLTGAMASKMRNRSFITGQWGEIGSWIKALEALLDTKESLDANANQKLALSCLGVRLRRCFPSGAVSL